MRSVRDHCHVGRGLGGGQNRTPGQNPLGPNLDQSQLTHQHCWPGLNPIGSLLYRSVTSALGSA